MQYILSFENFMFVDVLAVKVNGSDVKPGICLGTPRCFNIQNLFSSNSTYSVQNQVKFLVQGSKYYRYVKSPTMI